MAAATVSEYIANTARFPLDSPIPVDLVARLARLRVKERRKAGPRGGD